MYLKKLMEKREQAKVDMSDMLKLAETEERAFSEDEQKLFEDLEKQIISLTDTIEKFKSGRELTKEEKSETVVDNGNVSKEERARDKEEIEIREFASYIRNEITETRADVNLEKGTNGAIVPVSIADKIITKAYDISPILEKATKYKTKGKLQIPVYGADASGNDITMTYADEFKELESKIGKTKSIDLTGFLAGALTKLSNSLINNTDIDIVNKVIELMAETVSRFLEKEAIKGTTNKVTGCSDIELKVEAGVNSAITADELIKLKNKIKKIFRKNAVWIMSNDTLTAVELLKDSNGRYLFTEDLTGEYDGKILGYPVFVSDNMDEIGAEKIPVLFGDFSGLALKQTQELEIQILREKFATEHATGIVAWTEVDIKVEHLQKLAKLEMPI